MGFVKCAGGCIAVGLCGLRRRCRGQGGCAEAGACGVNGGRMREVCSEVDRMRIGAVVMVWTSV